MEDPKHHGRRLIRGDQVYGPNGVTTLSRSQVAEMIRAGEFPKPIKISRNRVAFLADEIDAFIEGCPRVGRLAPE